MVRSLLDLSHQVNDPQKVRIRYTFVDSNNIFFIISDKTDAYFDAPLK